MKVTITEADIREALPRFMPICTPRLMEEALVEIRRAALRRELDRAHSDAARLADVCLARATELAGAQGDGRRYRPARRLYDEARAASARAERRARKLFGALMGTFGRVSP